MRTKILLAVSLLLTATAVAGCRDGRPGYDSDRHHGHHGHHRGDHRYN
ncbi:hypothetical protein [Sphingomonas panacis]|nr:hypothetical protein [Sphingomonas panacis]